MWHIDEFSSLADTRQAGGPNSVAFDAFGSRGLSFPQALGEDLTTLLLT